MMIDLSSNEKYIEAEQLRDGGKCLRLPVTLHKDSTLKDIIEAISKEQVDLLELKEVTTHISFVLIINGMAWKRIISHGLDKRTKKPRGPAEIIEEVKKRIDSGRYSGDVIFYD